MATVPSQFMPPPSAGNLLGQVLPDDVLYEVVDSKIRELPPTGVRENLVAATLMRLLAPFAWNQGLGPVIAETLFLLVPPPRDLQRRPDVAYVSFDRWPRSKDAESTAAWEVVPNLAIEIVSPTNGANEIVEKIEDYFHAGVEGVWVLYPTVQKVYVYDAPAAVQILNREQVLEGGRLLPGFRLSLAEVFEDRAKHGEPHAR
jgi:Uma2 family endonuclease